MLFQICCGIYKEIIYDEKALFWVTLYALLNFDTVPDWSFPRSKFYDISSVYETSRFALLHLFLFLLHVLHGVLDVFVSSTSQAIC